MQGTTQDNNNQQVATAPMAAVLGIAVVDMFLFFCAAPRAVTGFASRPAHRYPPRSAQTEPLLSTMKAFEELPIRVSFLYGPALLQEPGRRYRGCRSFLSICLTRSLVGLPHVSWVEYLRP